MLNDPTGHKPCDDEKSCDNGKLPVPYSAPPPLFNPSVTEDGISHGAANVKNKPQKRDECDGRVFWCELIWTDPAGVTPSPIQSEVVDDTFTKYGPDDPPTVNGQTFTPAYGGSGQIAYSIAELFTMGFPYLYYNGGLYKNYSGANVQGAFPVFHHNESGLNIIPGIAVYNNTGMYVNISAVDVNGAKTYFTDTRSLIPDNNIGGVRFLDPVIMPTEDMSLVINFRVIQSNGVYFGMGQINYEGPNYYPIYGPPPP